MQLGEWGRILEEEWLRTPSLQPYIRLDAYAIMPDHLDGIVIWHRDPLDPVGPQRVVSPQRVMGLQSAYSLRRLRQPRSVGSFVARFKAICTHRINQLRAKPQPPIWQRNYYEHVVRNRRGLERIRRYVLENPYRWVNRI